MKISIPAKKEIEIKTISLYLKVRDEFTAGLVDQDGTEVFSYEGYVPDFMPGEHYGDYVILDIDVETGMIKNWKRPEPEQLEKLFDKDED